MSARQLAIAGVATAVLLIAAGYFLLTAEAPELALPQVPTPAAAAPPAPLPPAAVAPPPAQPEDDEDELAPPASAPAEPPTERVYRRERLGQRDLERARHGSLVKPSMTSDKGALSEAERNEIRESLRTVRPAMKDCFERFRERFPPPQGVTMKFTIEGQGLNGRLRDGVVVESSVDDPRAAECFLAALSLGHFPMPPGGGPVTVTYPFRFVDRIKK